jgi:hypothetical protein
VVQFCFGVHFNIFGKVDGRVQHNEVTRGERVKCFAKRVCGELAVDKQCVCTTWCRAVGTDSIKQRFHGFMTG